MYSAWGKKKLNYVQLSKWKKKKECKLMGTEFCFRKIKILQFAMNSFFSLNCPLKKVVYLQALGHRSQFRLVNTGRDPSLQHAPAPTQPSAGLLPGAHTGSAGSSGGRGRLPALSSCNSSFSFR